MEWKLSPEQRAYQEAFRDWLSDAAPPQVVRGWLDQGDTSSVTARFADGGWAGVGLPEGLGGQGGGLVELALTAEELARAAVPSAAWLATVLAVPALAGQAGLAKAAIAGQAAALLVPADAPPDQPVCIQAAPNQETQSQADADGRLTGVVPRVLAGDTAAWFVVPVGPGGARELRLVDGSDPGVIRTGRRLLDRSRSAADVTLDRVPSVPLTPDAVAVPATPGALAAPDATALLTQAAARAAVLVAADSLGAAGRMLDLSVAYSKQRRQFGVPIGSFQAVKHAAAGMEVGIEAGRSGVYFAAASVDAGDPQSLLQAAAVKAQVTADGARAAEAALTIHGAIGYTWEYDLQLFFKRAKLDLQLFGTPAAWNERIADALALV